MPLRGHPTTSSVPRDNPSKSWRKSSKSTSREERTESLMKSMIVSRRVTVLRRQIDLKKMIVTKGAIEVILAASLNELSVHNGTMIVEVTGIKRMKGMEEKNSSDSQGTTGMAEEIEISDRRRMTGMGERETRTIDIITIAPRITSHISRGTHLSRKISPKLDSTASNPREILGRETTTKNSTLSPYPSPTLSSLNGSPTTRKSPMKSPELNSIHLPEPNPSHHPNQE
jgi:hypothetical protein